MQLETIASVISSVGFPIMCCYIMWKYINTTLKDFRNTISENTKMLSKICEMLDEVKENRYE